MIINKKESKTTHKFVTNCYESLKKHQTTQLMYTNRSTINTEICRLLALSIPPTNYHPMYHNTKQAQYQLQKISTNLKFKMILVCIFCNIWMKMRYLIMSNVDKWCNKLCKNTFINQYFQYKFKSFVSKILMHSISNLVHNKI